MTVNNPGLTLERQVDQALGARFGLAFIPGSGEAFGGFARPVDRIAGQQDGSGFGQLEQQRQVSRRMSRRDQKLKTIAQASVVFDPLAFVGGPVHARQVVPVQRAFELTLSSPEDQSRLREGVQAADMIDVAVGQHKKVDLGRFQTATLELRRR